MGKCFSDAVEEALRYIYYDMRSGKGQEGLRLLQEASDAGDGDASCILARCLSGPQYIWSGHHFPEDERKATRLYHKSVEQGSAIGVLVSIRCGELLPELERRMPYANLQEVFDVVLQKAEAGDAFCQYVVGNTYFWWDFVRIQDKKKEDFASQEEFHAYMTENIAKCEDWFMKALKGGMYHAANNLEKFYLEGDEGYIVPQPEKAKGISKLGAELGYPYLQYFYADKLEDAGNEEEAFVWYKRALEGGEPLAWYEVGYAYELGKVVTQDYAYAFHCYESGYAEPHKTATTDNCVNGLGRCYFYGRGVEQDYGKARELLEQADWLGWEAYYILGCIYGQGLGVQEDIPKAVEYLRKAGKLDKAKEELRHYKRSLFGQWKRR